MVCSRHALQMQCQMDGNLQPLKKWSSMTTQLQEEACGLIAVFPLQSGCRKRRPSMAPPRPGKFVVSRKRDPGERRPMTLKQQIHQLLADLPEDSPMLLEFREALRMDRAIGEALQDVTEGRTYSAEDFTAKIQE
jgi:hypothetical protein